MKTYDFKKTKNLIEKNKANLKSASLGMLEDWFWTTVTVFEDGKYIKELTDETTIRGIRGSVWATPTLELVFKDGSKEWIDVFNNVSED